SQLFHQKGCSKLTRYDWLCFDFHPTGHPRGGSFCVSNQDQRHELAFRDESLRMNLGKWRSLRWRDIGGRQDEHPWGQILDAYGDLPVKPFLLPGGNREFPGLPYGQIEAIFLNLEVADVRGLTSNQQP